MQYGGEGDWTEADAAAHNATRPISEEIERLWAAIEILRRAMPKVQQRLDALERGRPMPAVMVPADAYERLRMFTVQLDGELLAIRQLVAANPGKLVLRRELLMILARTDYWYYAWKEARSAFDAPEWRGPAGKDGIWTTRT